METNLQRVMGWNWSMLQQKSKGVGKPTCAGKLKVHLQLNGKGLFELLLVFCNLI